MSNLSSMPFPTVETQFFLPGPTGRLELATTAPKQARTPGAVAIVCHPHSLHGGSMNNKVVTTLIRAFNQLGLYTIRFNFRGVEKSEGTYDAGIGETEDLRAVIHWVRHCLPAAEIWLAGFSFGSYVAARAATMIPVDQLISIAPPVHHFGFVDLPAVPAPWLVIQGDNDEVVDPNAVFAWVKKRIPAPRLIVMAEASHFFHGRLVELREHIVEQYSDK
jgi:uncharacterized protein